MDEFDFNRSDVKQYLKSLSEFQIEREGFILIKRAEEQKISEQDILFLNQTLKNISNIKIILPQDYAQIKLLNNKINFISWVNRDKLDLDVYKNLFDEKFKTLAPLATDNLILRLPFVLNEDFSLSDFRQLRSHLSQFNQYKFYFLGIDVLRFYLSLETLNYILWLSPLLALVFCLVLYLYFRHWVPVFYSLITLAFSMLVTLGVSIFLYGGFSPFVSIGILFVFVIGTSDLIHVFSHQAFAEPFDESSVSGIFREKLRVCFLTTLTTVMAFSSFLFSDMNVLKMLGVSCFVGLIVCFLFTFYILPHLMVKLHSSAPFPRWSTHLFQFKFGNFQKYFKFILMFLSVSLMFVFSGYFKFDFQQSPKKIFDLEHEYTQGINLYHQHFSPEVRSSILYRQGSDKSGLMQYLLADQRVTKILDQDDVFFQLTQNATAEDRLKIKSALESYQHPMQNIYQSDDHQRIMLFTRGDDLEDVLDDLDAYLQRNKLDHFIHIQSFEKLRNQFFKLLGQSLFISLLWTFVLIFLTIQITYKNIKISLIAIFVNVIPCILALIFAKWMGFEFNMNIVISISLLLGLGVDDTIHYLESFCRNKGNTIHTFQAIQMTSYVLILLFLLLSMSNVIIFQDISLVLSFGLIWALLYDCFLLPLLLERFVTPSLKAHN
jgi:hypothetical protein